MRKIIFLLTILVSGMFSFQSVSAGVVTTCDQTFYGELRHGKGYNFGDIFTNGTNTQVWLRNYWTDFEYQGDYNGSAGDPTFPWTSWIANKSYSLQPGESGEVVKSTPQYNLVYHPTTRNNKNLVVKYKAEYFKAVNGSWDGPYYHTECKNYTITFCGDGVRDTGYETCDPADTSKSGWGTGGCNNSCQPVTAVEPVCNSVSVADNNGDKTHSTSVSCTGTNAEQIIVDCGNGVTQTFTGNANGTKTVSRTCTYTSAGSYNTKCSVKRDGKITTTPQCSAPINVTNPLIPSIIIDKRDANASGDSDGRVGNDTQTVAQGAVAIFKITVTNNGNENLKNVVVTDPRAPQCNRTIGNLAVGQSNTYTCSQSNTQNAYTNTANVTGVGVTSNGRVNDTDPTRVEVVIPTCINLSATPNSGTASLTSNFSCTGNNVDSYKILVKNAAGNVINTINGRTGSYTFNTAGTYSAMCMVNSTITSQACIKPITVNPQPVPSITVDKTDANPTYDTDGGVRDTQTVKVGDKARFKIRVTNNGTEDLKNIVLTDARALACGGSVTLPSTKPSTFSGFRVAGQGDHSDSYLQPGEYFEYYCEKANTTSDYTNTVKVDANGRNTNTPVAKTDPTDIRVVQSVCTGLEVDKTSGTVDFVSNFTCTGTNVNTYTILVRDASGNVVSTINSNVGQYNFTNAGTYTVSCYMDGRDTTQPVCEKTVVANEETNPEITLTKLDANSTGDSDGQIGNDTQTVVTGEKAVFRIIVENSGTEDLDTIVLTDTIAPQCAGTVELPGIRPSTFENFTVSGAGNNSDAILQPGEKFEYTCEKANTIAGYTNLAKVDAQSTKDNAPVESEDTTVVETGVYDLALVKKVINQKTSYNKDDELEFEIVVHNQGTIDATDVVVSDYIPTGLTLADVAWGQTGSIATRNVGNVSAGQIKTVTITFKITATEGTIINWAEISSTGDSYTDVDSTPDANNNNDCHGGLPRTEIDPNSDDRLDGTGDANGNGTCDEGEDEDDHDPASINVSSSAPSILIEKYSKNDADLDGNITHTEATDDTQTVASGEEAVFEIKVTNNGNEDLVDVIVTDPLAPLCNKTIGALAIGETQTYTCQLAGTTAAYTNVAKVDAKGKDSGTPVTDEDDTKILLQGTNGPAITIEKYSNQGSTDQDNNKDTNPADDSQTITRGDTAKFNIVVTNTGNEALTNIKVTDVIAPLCDNDFGTLTLQPGESTTVYSCERDNTTSDYTNTAAVTADGVTSGTEVTDSDTSRVDIPGGSGGGSSLTCNNSTFTNVVGVPASAVIQNKRIEDSSYSSGTVVKTDVTCDGSADRTMQIDCGNGTTSGVLPADSTFTCEYTSEGSYSVQCDVSRGSNGGAWTSSLSCKNSVVLGSSNGGGGGGGGPAARCGDGVVHPLLGEQCDSGAKNGTAESTCTNSCKLKTTGGSRNCANSPSYYADNLDECDGTVTIPTGGDMIFGQGGNALIGHGMDALDGRYVYIKNNGTEEIFLDNALCVLNADTNKNILTGGESLCNGNDIQWLFPGNETRLLVPSTYFGTTDNHGSSTQKSTDLTITLGADAGQSSNQYLNSYFAETVNVTVAKPSIITRGGGTTYLAADAGEEISNVGDLAQAAGSSNTAQRNFVATVLGEGSDLSNVDTLNDTELVEEAEAEGEAYATGAVEVLTDIVESVTLDNATDLSDFTSYNGISNVKYMKDKNLKIDSNLFAGITTPTTFIIENGNMDIKSNITTNSNVAFIVKGGDINVAGDVTSIDGTYIAIKKGLTGGKITSANTPNQLAVNGSLYGDLEKLTSNRTYIAKESDGSIGVGTIVSFGSSILSKPAPLVSKFIGEYLDSSKVAQ